MPSLIVCDHWQHPECFIGFCLRYSIENRSSTDELIDWLINRLKLASGMESVAWTQNK